MRLVATLQSIGLIARSVGLTSSRAATKADVHDAVSRGGLQKVRVKGLDLAYAKPGATLAAYKRVKLDPVEVEFDKLWNPSKTGSRLGLGHEDREKIKASVAMIVDEEFAKALQKRGTYSMASESAPGVLRVKARILNLYVNAPSGGGRARSRTSVSGCSARTAG